MAPLLPHLRCSPVLSLPLRLRLSSSILQLPQSPIVPTLYLPAPGLSTRLELRITYQWQQLYQKLKHFKVSALKYPCFVDIPHTSYHALVSNTHSPVVSRPTLEGLLAMSGHAAPIVDIDTLSPSRIEEVRQLYVWYAVGLDKLLECQWFQVQGAAYAMASPRIVGFYSTLLDGFYSPDVHDPAVIARLEVLEARIVWESLCLCRTARAQEPAKGGNTGAKPDPQLVYAVKRLSIVEALMTGTIIDSNPLARHHYPEDDPSVPPPGIAGQIKNRELQFWESMGDYLAITNEDPNANLKRDHALLMARAYLDTLENRDVIYSIGIVRHISKFKPKKFKLPTATDEKDAAAKLYVACRFLEDELNGKASTQATKRLSMLMVRYWDDPSNQ